MDIIIHLYPECNRGAPFSATAILLQCNCGVDGIKSFSNVSLEERSCRDSVQTVSRMTAEKMDPINHGFFICALNHTSVFDSLLEGSRKDIKCG